MGWIRDIEAGILEAAEDVALAGRVACSRAETEARRRGPRKPRKIPTGEAGAAILGALLNPFGVLTSGNDGSPQRPGPSGGGSIFT